MGKEEIIKFVNTYTGLCGDLTDLPKEWIEQYEEAKKNTFPKRITLYLHGSKEENYHKGIEMGLSEEALKKFRYCLMELSVEIEVKEDGTYKIIKTSE